MSNFLSGWLTPEQAAKKVGKSTQTIYHHIKNNHLEVEKVGGRIFIKEESLFSYYRYNKELTANIIET